MLSKSSFLQSSLPFTQTQHQLHFPKRTRLKLKLNPPNRITASISPQFDRFDPLTALHLPISLNSLQILAPVLGLAAGAALYLSGSKPKPPHKEAFDSETGEWRLLASATPFNRFVFQRCPSIAIEGELRGKLSGNSVKVQARDVEVEMVVEEEHHFGYQRMCIGMDDGGVVSLDWPEELPWREESGRETTVVIVPGTAEGSMEESVRLFVRELVQCGCFPVVMNPRGCAGSPLTTARLFTAADSDDICTTVKYINKARPCNTLMAVGWGHGANMLTKYLAEVAERTPLTAAASINNPFDLEETTKSFSYHVGVDQKLTSGLIDILRSNKELFVGREKGFNVEEALSARSLRDFDREISMISYGFESIEEFYSESSTSDLVGNVKIPLLFIQTDDVTVPPFSIPRSSVAENPFTSMFLCSRLHSTTLTTEKTMMPWYEHLVIEWLTSVEFGLLKGHHPVNSINHDTANKSHRMISESAESRGEIGEMLDQSSSDDTAIINNTVESLADNERSQGENCETLDQSGSDDTSLESNAEKTSADNERSQVLQSAKVVMNMLDISMPGTLQEEQKKKVLTSIEQGETLMKSLEGVVPEDVRGKLTTAVSEIATTQGTKLDLDGIVNISQEQIGRGNGMPGVSDDTNLDVSDAKNEPSSESEVEESPATSATEPPQVQKESNPVKKDEDKNLPPVEDQNKQAPPESDEAAPPPVEPDANPPDAPEGIDALTEFDDSTQVAVNSVFGIVENMIDKSEDDNAQEKDEKQGKSEDGEPSSTFEESPVSVDTEDKLEDDSAQEKDEKQEKSEDGEASSAFKESPDKSEDENPREKGEKQGKSEDEEPTSALKESPVSSDTEDKSGILQTNDGLNLESDQRQRKHPVGNHQDKSADEHQNVHIDMDEKQLNQDGESSSTFKESPVYMDEKQLDKSHSAPLKKNNSSFSSVANEKEKMTGETDTVSAKTADEVGHLRKVPLYVIVNPSRDSLYDEHIHPYLLSSNSKLPDLNSTADLLLNYLPKEGQWQFLNQTENNSDPNRCHGAQPINGSGQVMHSAPLSNDRNKTNEPSNMISDTGKKQQPIEKRRIEGPSEQPEEEQRRSELLCSVKNIILESLKVEVDHRLGLPDMKEKKELDSNLAPEMDHVAEMVSLALARGKDLKPPENTSTSAVVCPLLGDDIAKTVSLAINDSVYLKKVLPVEVIIESSLAALKEYYIVEKELNGHASEIGSHKPVSRKQLSSGSNSSTKAAERHDVANSYTVIAGAVTALGASTLLGHERSEDPYNSDESADISSGDHSKIEKYPKKLDVPDKKGRKHKVSNLAEKAMSVAAPVIPTKSDGGLDQDRLVTTLSDLGQQGGVLKTLGKVALLWGGARGAVRLTDRLIAFLHIADRPLYQRLLGFAFMVLVLWSPVVIPLFPTMVKAWAMHSSIGIAEYACTIGLYAAVAALVLLWGKRIRGYEDPLEQYGLDLTSKAKLFDFLKGLMGGIMFVLSIHAINALLGFAHLSWSSLPSSSADAIKACGGLLVLIGRGIMTATIVVIVEEILFRSWLPAEISLDFGYHRAVIFSGFVFSVLQRSLHSIPGLWLLSIALFGLRQKSKGSLSIPIGMRAGILSTSFLLQTGRFLIYHSSYPLWLVGVDPFQPFGGAVGLAFSIMLAILFYPKKPQGTKETQRAIRE